MTSPRDLATRRRAVTETAANVVVSAGAGTGKTSLMVERLLVLIGAGAPLRSIAAITFTEKAAGELRLRLAEGLDELALLAERGGTAAGTPAARALAHLAARGLEPARVVEAARDAALHLDRATVTTIHGFCTEILRLHPIESGLPPGFQVDRGPSSLRLAREEWAIFLEEELGNAGPREELWRTALAALGISDLEKLGRGLSRGAIPARVLAGAYEPLGFASTLGEAAARIAADLRACRTIPGLTPAPLAWLDEALDVLDPAAAGDVDGARRALEASERLSDPLKARTKNVAKADSIRVEASARGALQLIRCLRSLDEPALTAAIEAVLPYARRLRDRLDRAGLVDFDTLLVVARDLLRDRREVREALKERFDSVLVDEFQDTDPLQYEIVFFLAERRGELASEAWSARLAPGRLFIVGDAKQSIYRFRGADFGAYRRAVARVLEEGGIELALTANFRSVPGILGPVNVLGRRWTPTAYLPAYEPIEAERTGSVGPAVEIWTTPSGTADADERRKAEARAIASGIRALAAEGTAYSDVLVLIRAFTNVPVYLRELREAGIPFVASGGKTFYERTEVVQALAVLRAVADPGDAIARLAYLRSPAGGVPDAELLRGAQGGPHPVATPALHDAEARLTRWREEIAPLPVDSAVRCLLERTGLIALNALGFEGAQRVANLEKLAGEAAEFARDGRLTLLELLDALAERPRGEEEGESPLADETTQAVRVMTIHKAKGLEAPIVVLADAAAARNHVPDRDWKVGIHLHAGRELLAVEGPNATNTASAVRRLEGRAHEEAEDLRLLYVALTRARERLIVLAGTAQGRSPWMEALAAWGYDARSAPPDGTLLLDGAVLSRTISATKPPAPPNGAIPAGAPEAVRRYAEAIRAIGSATGFLSPSARVEAPPAPAAGIGPALARAVGSAIHERLAGLEARWEDDGVASEVREILDRFEGSELAGRLRALDVIGREVPILLRDDRGTAWRGSIDLLYRDADGTLVIADYKTDAELPGAAERHRPQLAVYVDGLRRALPSSRVRAELWMLRHAAIVAVE